MTYYKGTKVIASIGASPSVTNETILSANPPQFRSNGGDLRTGDRWYNTTSGLESLWSEGLSDAGSWHPIRTQSNVITSTTPPTNPAPGDLWFRSDIGRLYVYYQDDNSAQWINADAS
jgi:hypothetical protein